MTVRRAVSLTATGDGRPLARALGDALKLAVGASPSAGTRPVVSLSIGAQPVDDPWSVLDGARRAVPDLELVAHHTVPLGRKSVLRPGADSGELLEALLRGGIATYSAHPPPRREASEEELWTWARAWWQAARRQGVSFALETMYPVASREEAQWGTGWHLDSPDSVAAFLDRAQGVGWTSPLVIDGAHLHIGMTSGTWKAHDVEALVARCADSGACAEAHVSANDGVRDRHDRPGRWPQVDSWVEGIALSSGATLVVDEGRRR